MLETREGALLRTVIPIRNREACHRCHEARHSINGVLIVDVDAGSIRTAMNRDISWMLAGTGLLALVLTGTIGGVVRLVVIGRLKRFETTARLIAAGDFERRVPAAGFDTIDWLAREFNSMADSLGNLVSEVRQQGERLETVINSIDDGIVVLDAERKVIAANEAFLQRTGRYRSAVLGVSCLNSTAGMCNTTDCPALSCLQSGAKWRGRKSTRRPSAARAARFSTSWRSGATSRPAGPRRPSWRSLTGWPLSVSSPLASLTS